MVARNVARLRKSRGLRQEDFGRALARYTGREWSRQTVYEAEAGTRRIAADELVAFAEVLDVPLSAFYEPPGGVEEVTFPSGWTMEARGLIAGFLTPETQKHLGTFYEMGALRRHASQLRMALRGLTEGLDEVSGHRDLADQIASDLEALRPAPPRKRSHKQRRKR